MTRSRWLHFFLILWISVSLAACGSKPRTEAPVDARRAGSAAAGPESTADSRSVIVALGDSLTAGRGVDPDSNYPSLLQSKIDEAGYHYRVVNAGVSGDTSAQGLNRLEAVRRLHAAVVIVELGANDGLRGMPVSETRKNLEEIVATLKKDGAKVVLAGMEMPPNYGPVYTRQFRDMFPELAKEYGVGLIPFFLQGVGGRPELNQEDGIHPTAQGYTIVTENVWKVLEPLLKRQPRITRIRCATSLSWG